MTQNPAPAPQFVSIDSGKRAVRDLMVRYQNRARSTPQLLDPDDSIFMMRLFVEGHGGFFDKLRECASQPERCRGVGFLINVRKPAEIVFVLIGDRAAVEISWNKCFKKHGGRLSQLKVSDFPALLNYIGPSQASSG